MQHSLKRCSSSKTSVCCVMWLHQCHCSCLEQCSRPARPSNALKHSVVQRNPQRPPVVRPNLPAAPCISMNRQKDKLPRKLLVKILNTDSVSTETSNFFYFAYIHIHILASFDISLHVFHVFKSNIKALTAVKSSAKQQLLALRNEADAENCDLWSICLRWLK